MMPFVWQFHVPFPFKKKVNFQENPKLTICQIYSLALIRFFDNIRLRQYHAMLGFAGFAWNM